MSYDKIKQEKHTKTSKIPKIQNRDNQFGFDLV